MPGSDIPLEAIRAEGRKWMALAMRVERIVPRARTLELHELSFSVADPTFFNVVHAVNPHVPDLGGVHHQAYRDFHEHMVDLLGGAAGEFVTIGTALRNMADHYEENEEMTGAEFDDMFTDGR